MAAYTDTIMILGIVIFGLAFPSAVGAFSRGAPPRAAIIAFVIGGGMVAYAHTRKPGGYKLEQIPDLFMKVITGA